MINWSEWDIKRISFNRCKKEENVFSFFHSLDYLDETIFTGTLKNRIRSFSIDVDTNGERRPKRTTIEALFTHILSTFSNLRTLNFNPNALWHQHLSFDTLSPSVRSSTVLELHVCVFGFNDCLRFLDGGFSQLRIFDVKIDYIFASLSDVIDNKVNHLISVFRLIERNWCVDSFLDETNWFKIVHPLLSSEF